MTQVTKESLAKRIAELESGPRSLKEDYQLEAFKMLYVYMEDYDYPSFEVALLTRARKW